jgi:Leucine Rich repeats (2 copies)
MDDVDLPPLPPASSSRTRPALLTRKRTRDDYDDVPPSAASSDPALFSGDEAVPGAEDYAFKRKKKMYTGSWWSYRVKAKPDEKKREFKRNYDSGIFMGSEGSEHPSSDSLGSLEEELIQDQRKMEVEPKTSIKPPSSNARPFLKASTLPFQPAVSDVPPEHGMVMQIVQRCLDNGQEDVDLSSMSLTTLPSGIIDLTTLTKQTTLVSGMLEHGEPLEPQLRLFLANNLLRRVPREILDLTNLRVLSMRRNKLTSLPPGIRNLVNLETLNLAGNKLAYLPWELIGLARFHRLKNLTAEPNAWLPKPDLEDPGVRWTRPGADRFLWRWQPLSKISSTPSYSNPQVMASHSSPVPSLTETTLRSLLHLAPPHADLRSYMPPDTPERVLAALETLHDAQLDGGHHCSRCGRAIVQPGHEWIEWWAFGPEAEMERYVARGEEVEFGKERAWPVKRMACWRGCVGERNAWCDLVGVEETGFGVRVLDHW